MWIQYKGKKMAFKKMISAVDTHAGEPMRVITGGVDISINLLAQSAKTTSPSTAIGEPLLITNGLMSIS